MRQAGRQRGFTFLELMLVVGLIALLGGMLLPGIPRALPYQIRSASRVLSADLRYAEQRAIATGRAHVWVVDLDAQAFRVEQRRELPPPVSTVQTGGGLLDLRPPKLGSEQVPVDSSAGNWHYLDEEDVSIALVRIGDREWKQGVAEIAFSSDGGADPAELWLEDASGRTMRIRIYAFTGEVRVDEDPDA